VVFPVYDRGELYGYQERFILPTKYIDPSTNEEREIPKILSSTGIPRERMLMFSDRLIGSPHAILAEGPVDAIKAHLCGGNVATMGKAVGAEQFRLLLNGGIKKVYLGLDPDASGEFRRLARTYYDEVEMYDLRPKATGGGREKLDLGAMSFEDVYRLFLDAERIFPGQLFTFLNRQT